MFGWSPQPSREGRHLVLFDGYCGLCDRAVSFLLRRDRHGVLTYAPLQGETGLAVRQRFEVSEALDSMLFVEDHGTPEARLHVRSGGALQALAKIGGPWRWLSAPFRLVPRPLRDAIYEFVAKRRLLWFGTLDTCRVPSVEERDRFLP